MLARSLPALVYRARRPRVTLDDRRRVRDVRTPSVAHRTTAGVGVEATEAELRAGLPRIGCRTWPRRGRDGHRRPGVREVRTRAAIVMAAAGALLAAGAPGAAASWSAPERLGPALRADAPPLAVAPDGRAALLIGGPGEAVLLRLRAADGRWGAAEPVARSARHPVVGIDARGRVTVVWERRLTGRLSVVVARTRRADGAWEPARRLGPVIVRGGRQPAPALAVAPDGRAYAAWQQGSPLDDYRIAYAERISAGGWSGITLVEQPLGVNAGPPRVAAASGGAAVVAWSGVVYAPDSPGTPLHAISRRRGTWSALETATVLPCLCATPVALALSPSGAVAIAAPAAPSSTAVPIRVALRAAEGPWRASELAGDVDGFGASVSGLAFASPTRALVLARGDRADLGSFVAGVETPVAGTAPLAPLTGAPAGPASLTALPGGGALAAWAAPGRRIVAHRFDAAGRRGVTELVARGRAAAGDVVALAVDRRGRPTVAWNSGVRTPTTIVATRHGGAR